MRGSRNPNDVQLQLQEKTGKKMTANLGLDYLRPKAPNAVPAHGWQ
jgi:hypothetical protein